ncbi:Condensation domain-containing protein [Nonomuraea solani]|uniref:Condensation domain-containing protein n=1 Tax=Nonomuraea solani TaxID=1144553 RepID=A0A1H6EWM0_9ACTN|nr:condensation domain-containing protein [Nonomuraea solani]SEH01269.1 Condensation domain-containing protein [Nonomuraea solani]
MTTPPAGPLMPLTGAQAGIWFAQRLDPANPVYNTAGRVDLRGPLDAAVFERALARCLAEAEPLRLRFTEEPAQYLREYDSLRGSLTVLDLRGEADPEAAADAWMRADLRTPVAEAWRPYVGGVIETHDVACGHKGMIRPGPMAEIGAMVAARLQEPTS